MKTDKTNIRTLSKSEILEYFEDLGEPKFRAGQVYEWIWQKHAFKFEDMTNLSKELRAKLAKDFTFPALRIDTTQHSADGTVKTRFKTFDNHFVEGVLIPTDERRTACVSSQIGCSLSCKFCATGYMDRERNLEFDEIYDQVVIINQQAEKTFDKKLSNIVFMGMGEPLLNYKNVLRAIDKISSADGLGMSPRRITVSTAGVAKMIRQLGDDKVKFKLALSLHAANDQKRHEIMPINDSNNIRSLIDALNYFYKETGNEITFEYILFQDFNDGLKDADELIKIYRQVPADLVNIIEYNPITNASFAKPDESVTNIFMKHLEKNKVNARLRRSRGKDIDAACGQLANKKRFSPTAMKRKTDNFSKFINRKSTGAVKEEIRQEKKLIKKERKEGIERHFEEKRNKRAVAASLKADAPFNTSGKPVKEHKVAEPAPGATIPLNKYVAHAGVSSRRAAATLVKDGKVTVNGIAVTDPGTKVLYTDTVKVAGKKVTVSSHFVYILLNKPKDFLTTTTDPQGRKTVQQLIAKATDERVYPIGRLDRNTSGVLLFTNDGDLAQKLSHPKNEMKKIYHVGLDKPLTKQHFEKIMGGVELEDGIAKVDEMAYADPKDKTQIGLEIHSGKNRIVRRIFAALGYDVKTLDRVMYAGLTKKNVQRGNWRFLTEKEIRELKYLKS